MRISFKELLSGMYWGYGQKILKAASYIKEARYLCGNILTNFGCELFLYHPLFKRVIREAVSSSLSR
jgi:predicted nucleotide-binding protein (sugar kinase/HSP70/actin superfamily)